MQTQSPFILKCKQDDGELINERLHEPWRCEHHLEMQWCHEYHFDMPSCNEYHLDMPVCHDYLIDIYQVYIIVYQVTLI